MKITVEFVGISRIFTGEKNIELNLHENDSFQSIVEYIGKTYPNMIGEIIEPEGLTFYGSNMFNRNGTQMIQPEDMDQCPADGDHLILMSLLAGG